MRFGQPPFKHDAQPPLRRLVICVSWRHPKYGFPWTYLRSWCGEACLGKRESRAAAWLCGRWAGPAAQRGAGLRWARSCSATALRAAPAFRVPWEKLGNLSGAQGFSTDTASCTEPFLLCCLSLVVESGVRSCLWSARTYSLTPPWIYYTRSSNTSGISHEGTFWAQEASPAGKAAAPRSTVPEAGEAEWGVGPDRAPQPCAAPGTIPPEGWTRSAQGQK